MSPTVRLIVRPTVLVLLLAALPAFAQAPARPAPPPARTVPVPATGTEAALPKPRPTRNPAFYNAELTISSQNAAERRGATIRALGQVLVRLTGNPQAAANPVIRRASSNIDSLVLESKVRQDSDTVNGVPVYKTVLSVSFNPDSVDALLAGAGLKFWTSTRPKPILWLAIDDGRGPRLVTGQQTNVVKPLATRGLERGMRFLLPAGTSVEQAAVPSILALNGPALQVLTNRYRNDAQLVGKVYRRAPGWAADWLLSQDGVELARWSFADSDPRRVIASGVDEGANAIAKRDAVLLDTGAAGPQLVEVSGVNSQGDFIRLMSYLQTLAVVRKVTVVEARPGSLRLQLDLGVGMRGFLPMVSTGTVLVPDSEPAIGGVTRFSLQ
jgi:hypothetical protein